MLDLSLTTVLFTFVNFIALFLLLRWLLMRPVGELLETRRQTVAKDLDNARQNREESEKQLAEHRELLVQGREEARQIIEEAMRQGELRRQEILAATTQEADDLRTRVQIEIGRERDKAISELRQEVLALAVALAEKLLAREVKASDQDQMFEELLNELGDNYAKYGS